MADIDHLTSRLGSIAEASSLGFADLAAGHKDGLQLRFRFTGSTTLSPEFASFETTRDGQSSGFDLPDRRYLIASITKPVVGMLGVQLAAEGQLALNEPVRDYVEGFHRGPLRNITIRHLMTHTSGLPDMLPNNVELRTQHATLAEFVGHTARVTPEFAAGSDCRYSSMGIAVLALIMERLFGSSIHEITRQYVYEPLEMTGSWLGLPADHAAQLMPTVVPSELPPGQQPDSDWNWNSRYWRSLGAPWGGMISTAEDLGRFAMCLLADGRAPRGQSVFTPAAVRTATDNQTCHMPGLSESDRQHRPWGLGWRFNWPDHSTCFSDFLPSRAFGHWGATGTLMWIDPQSQRWCVILTNQPYEESQSVIQRMSNLVAGAAW